MLALVLLFRSPGPPPAPVVPTPVVKTVVQLARPGSADELLKQETELRDLRPLFLPTERNAALAEPRREQGRTFLDDESPKSFFSDGDSQVTRDLPPVATVNGNSVEKAEPVDALAIDAAGTALLGFGRRASEITPVAERARGGFVEVVAARDGQIILSESLPATARPPGDKAWAPMEFLATIDAAGLIGPLVVTEGSLVEEADLFFRNYLARTFRIGERLPPGFYRIIVAP